MRPSSSQTLANLEYPRLIWGIAILIPFTFFVSYVVNTKRFFFDRFLGNNNAVVV